MEKLKKDIKIFKINIDLISLIVGIIIFIAMLLFGLLKVAYNVRGVTLIFGRGNNPPQWFAIVIFSTMLIIGVTLFANILFRNILKDGKRIEQYSSSVASIIIISMGIVSLLSSEFMDGNTFTSLKSLDIGGILGGILLIFAGVLLFLRFNLEMIKQFVLIINQNKRKRTTNENLLFELEKIGTLIISGIQISKNDKAIIDIINLYWNLQQLTMQLNISETEKTKLFRENDRMMRYIKSLNIEVNDYVNRVYNNMNLEILTFETNNDLTEKIVIRTVEPEIRFNNIIIQRSKVVIAGPDMIKETQNG